MLFFIVAQSGVLIKNKDPYFISAFNFLLGRIWGGGVFCGFSDVSLDQII